MLNAAFTRSAEAAGPNPETGVWDPFGMRCADALVELAAQHLADDPGPDPTMVVVHVDCDVVDGTTEGNGSIDGVAISHESVLRLLCDTTIECNIDGPDGTCIGVGRASKVPPRWLRRRIIRRDVTCRFPGCCRRIRQVHHIQHWTKDGPTDSWNLASRQSILLVDGARGTHGPFQLRLRRPLIAAHAPFAALTNEECHPLLVGAVIGHAERADRERYTGLVAVDLGRLRRQVAYVAFECLERAEPFARSTERIGLQLGAEPIPCAVLVAEHDVVAEVEHRVRRGLRRLRV